jgi:hypothetical protein
VIRRAREVLNDWQKAKENHHNRGSSTVSMERQNWTKPPMGKLKCNQLNLIQNCKVSHIKRQANRVAHDLAQTTHFLDST